MIYLVVIELLILICVVILRIYFNKQDEKKLNKYIEFMMKTQKDKEENK